MRILAVCRSTECLAFVYFWQDIDKTTAFHILLAAGASAAVAMLTASLWLVLFRYFPKQLIYFSIGFNVLFTMAIAIVSFAVGSSLSPSYIITKP